ncbi:MAG: ribosome biogenesis GTPase Der [Planctomycetota bacterium]
MSIPNSVPKIAIVGRPNVGKSSILNWLSGRRIAIVDDFAGVTRDRVSQLVEHEDQFLEFIDTGGIGITDRDDLAEDVEAQIRIGISEADLILFVVDSQTGLLPLDQEVAKRLRSVEKPVIFVANKADKPTRDSEADELLSLGFSPLLRVSTKANRNKPKLWEEILAKLPPPGEADDAVEEPEMKLAIVGRRNVGKSTFINALVQEERMIVSEIPGTTRDSVDVRFEMDGKSFLAIDTPGLRRRASAKKHDIDFYGTHRAQRSIRRADVVLLFFDSLETVGRVDKQLCAYILEHHKPCIFVVNKWDLAKDKAHTGDWADYLRNQLGMMWHVPIAFVTAKTGQNVKKLINHAQMLFKQSRQRVTTGQLNSLIQSAMDATPPPIYRHRRPKIYYATQVDVQPPTILLMCNYPKAFTASYRRYLFGVLRDQLDFGEVPIRLFFQKRSRDDGEGNET